MAGNISAEIQKLLPADSKDQIEIAFKIISNAYQAKMKVLEDEVQVQKETINEKINIVRSLEKRVTSLEMEIADLTDKNMQALEDEQRLQNEKTKLIETVKKLNREVVKLEHFKKSLLHQLQDDDPKTASKGSGIAEDVVADRLVSDVLSTTNQRGTSVPGTPQAANGEYAQEDKVPMIDNTMSKGAEENGDTQVDGKEFFKIARSRLSLEQFHGFLSVIKDLNSGKVDKNDALKQARGIFGKSNDDLYESFETMLGRH